MRGLGRGCRCAVVVLLLSAASSCSNERTLAPGKTCVINSDCTNPLSCTFGKCHEACRADGDCPAGERCVFGEVSLMPDAGPADGPAPDGSAIKVRVCLLDVEAHCSYMSACKPKLVCGRDLQCRNECEEDVDCPRTTDRCVIGGDYGEKLCAEPDATDGDGGLKTSDAYVPPDARPGDGAPDAGAPGDGAAEQPRDATATADGGPDAVATSDGGVTPDAPPVADAAPETGPDAPAAPDAPGDAPFDAGFDAASDPTDAVADAVPILVPEMEPNDDQSTATPYVLGTQVQGMLAAGIGDGQLDQNDYFRVTSPADDPSGGYFVATVSDVGNGGIHTELRAQSSNNGVIIAPDGAGNGESFYFFWATRPGQSYDIRLFQAGANFGAFGYKLKVVYTKIDDPFEVNDASDMPAPIALGTPVTAYFFHGFSSSQAPTPDQDWYEVTLNTGQTNVVIKPVPSDMRMQFQVYDEDFVGVTPVTGNISANLGASMSMGRFTAPGPGKYRIEIQFFSFVAGSVAGSSPTMLPDSFTKPYTLTVTQP